MRGGREILADRSASGANPHASYAPRIQTHLLLSPRAESRAELEQPRLPAARDDPIDQKKSNSAGCPVFAFDDVIARRSAGTDQERLSALAQAHDGKQLRESRAEDAAD